MVRMARRACIALLSLVPFAAPAILRGALVPTLSATPNPAPVGSVAAVAGTGFPNRKTRLLLDGVGATTNVFRPRRDGTFHVGITVASTVKSQALEAQQQQPGGNWSVVARLAPLLTFTPPVADTTAPVLLSVQAINITSTSFTVSYVTNEPSSTLVDYGTTGSYGSTASASTLVTTHTIVITGLTASTLYYYRARATDGAGNEVIGSQLTITTFAGGVTDTTAPVISGLVVRNITASSVEVYWTLNEYATGQVLYGTTPSLGLVGPLESSFAWNFHTFVVGSLATGTLYYYRVRSVDASNNIALSDLATWETAGGVATYVGYGKNVTGGTGFAEVQVTNLNASGAGSFAAAMGSNRRIVFTVEGTIDLTTVGDEIGGSGFANFTIDGSTAPGAGITLIKWGLEFAGCSNFIIRHLAIRDVDAFQFQSCLTLRNGCHDFILDHISADGYSHRGIDIYNGCYTGTISWCFIGPFGPTGLSNFPMLVGKIVDRISVDHCIFHDANTRMPQFDYDNTDGVGPVPTGITGDVANCLIHEWDYSGLTVHGNAWVNCRQTYFKSTTNTGANLAIHTETQAFVYQSGCTGSGVNITTANTAGTPYPVAAYAVLPLESTATVAANVCKAANGAGRMPRDATDTAFAAAITIT